jgi:hypothetical protein
MSIRGLASGMGRRRATGTPAGDERRPATAWEGLAVR